MREIKFRAWDFKNKKMREPDVYVLGELIINRYDGLMQFTGLLDKLGKEIYEGDIIKDEKNIFEIILVPGGFVAIEPKEKKSSFPIWNELANPQMHSWIANAEVIGNIYEKENLLSD